jgi:lysine 6-dehydrogenase
MPPRIALLGAGIVGSNIAADLAAWGVDGDVVIGDLDGARAAELAGGHGFDAVGVDVRDTSSLDGFLSGADVVINAAQYHTNLAVMEAALRARVGYLDLGGLFHTTRAQLELHRPFEDAGITAVLGIGSCPGIANVQAGEAAARLDTVERVLVYNAATVDRTDSLRWPYSIRTILDEMTRPAIVYHDGRFVEEPPLSGEEEFDFLAPVGRAHVHLSLHSEVATIPGSFAELGIRECAFRIRNFGFSDAAFSKLRLLVDLGLASEEPREVAGHPVVPRELLIDLLEELDPPPPEHEGFKDIATVVEGTRDGSVVRARLDTTTWPSEELGISGGALSVASPAAVVGRWLAAGDLARPGVHPPEIVVPPGQLWEALAERGMSTTYQERTELAGP